MTTQTTIQHLMQTLGKQAKAASRVLAAASTAQKNAALQAVYAALQADKPNILAANAKDMQNGQVNQLAAALLDRLELTDARFAGMLQGLTDVIALPDPVGEMTDFSYRPSGIQLGKMRVPLGVVGMIYESRPNVTLEAASLALKSGNAIILRGGSEAINSNQAIAKCIQTGLEQAGLPKGCVQVVETTDRAAVGELITLADYVDVIVPRGGKGLIARISREASVPVIKHLDGNCHTFIDSDADLAKALPIVVNAKTQRYGTCNTMETLLVDSNIAAKVLPKAVDAMLQADGNMRFRGCEKTLNLLAGKYGDKLTPATEDDWYEEYLAPILAVKIVDGIAAAINHINHYSSHHTDVIISENYTKARQFLREVDSSSVMVNASSRFADGFEYGLGAEIGISTDKIHARGPVGLHGLTSQKWVVLGDGQVRKA